jgi:hypothetical protein
MAIPKAGRLPQFPSIDNDCRKQMRGASRWNPAPFTPDYP